MPQGPIGFTLPVTILITGDPRRRYTLGKSGVNFSQPVFAQVAYLVTLVCLGIFK
jgi:hypothetical protein